MNEELMTMHKILLCPAECPPIDESDTITVRMLKGLIHNWHQLAREADELKRLRLFLVEFCKQAGVTGISLNYTDALDKGLAEIAKTETPNVKFSGATQLHRGASAGTQGSASPSCGD